MHRVQIATSAARQVDPASPESEGLERYPLTFNHMQNLPHLAEGLDLDLVDENGSLWLEAAPNPDLPSIENNHAFAWNYLRNQMIVHLIGATDEREVWQNPAVFCDEPFFDLVSARTILATFTPASTARTAAFFADVTARGAEEEFLKRLDGFSVSLRYRHRDNELVPFRAFYLQIRDSFQAAARHGGLVHWRA